MIEIHNEPCDCSPEACHHFVEPPEDCINRLTGVVRTLHCEICSPGSTGTTWHQNGRCLRCARIVA